MTPGLWSLDPAVLLVVVIAGGLYVRGWLRLKRRGVSNALAFACGSSLVLLALCSPIGAYDQQLFSLHMTEHLLLALGAAPLLLLGKPLVPLLSGLPPSERRTVARMLAPGRPLPTLGRHVADPRVAMLVYVGAFAVWHLPPLYDLAQGSSPAHYLEHLTFFATALMFWWPVIHPRGGPRRLPKMASIIYFALPMVEGTLIGGLLTFANAPLYATYVQAPRLTGLSVVEDQQLAGLIMWIPGGLVYAAAVLASLVGVLREEEAAPRLERQANATSIARDDTILFEHA
jgi:putative membrane protein